MNIFKKLAVGVTSTALMLSSAGVALASDTVNVTNTGYHSTNRVSMTMRNVRARLQTNFSRVWNGVNSTGDTGNNDANRNTGDASVVSGDVSTSVLVSNEANLNQMGPTDDCGCVSPHVNLGIYKTGAWSTNRINLKMTRSSLVSQANFSRFATGVSANSDTGNNHVNGNTGAGDVTSGDVDVVVQVTNNGNLNTL